QTRTKSSFRWTESPNRRARANSIGHSQLKSLYFSRRRCKFNWIFHQEVVKSARYPRGCTAGSVGNRDGASGAAPTVRRDAFAADDGASRGSGMVQIAEEFLVPSRRRDEDMACVPRPTLVKPRTVPLLTCTRAPGGKPALTIV